MCNVRPSLWALSPRPKAESSPFATLSSPSSNASKSYPVKLRSTESESPASCSEMPVSKNRTNVQSKANLPSGVDSRMRKGVCRSCHSSRYVKTSDSFSIEDTADCLQPYSLGESEGTKEFRSDFTQIGALPFSNCRRATAT